MSFEKNELNRVAKGGTELLMERLYSVFPLELLNKFQIIPSRVRELQEDKIRILYCHDLSEDPESGRALFDNGHTKFHKIVFVSNWQMQSFINRFDIPWSKCLVIPNSIEPIEYKERVNGPIKIIYHSTPHRGLNILVPVFEALAQVDKDIQLDVFSSFNLYGWGDRDAPYQELFDRCEAHPQINYHGTQPNAVIRDALQTSDIFAYPSIWAETSCQPKGSKILTKNGIKDIENIKIGDEVLTHKGNYKTVYTTFSRKTGESKLIKFTLQGYYNDIMFTPDHLILVGNTCKYKNKYVNNKIYGTEWVRADSINPNKHVLLRPKQNIIQSEYLKINISDYINMEYYYIDDNNCISYNLDSSIGASLHKVSNELTINEEFAFILGLFAGDGNANIKTNTMTFAHHFKEIDNSDKVLSYFNNISERYVISDNEIQTRVWSSIWCKFFYNTIGKKREKKIPDFIFDSNYKIQNSFIEGYYAADGSKTTGNKHCLSTISASLAYGLTSLLTSQGVFVSHRYDSRKKCHNMTWRHNPSKKFYNESDEYIGLRIKNISSIPFNGMVYNFEVEDDHSYVTEGVVVHNCLCLIEAMAAGNLCIHPNFGALYETASNWTSMYQFDEDNNRHANTLYALLQQGIGQVRTDQHLQSRLTSQSNWANIIYNWNNRKLQWEYLFEFLMNTVKDTRINNSQDKEIIFHTGTH